MCSSPSEKCPSCNIGTFVRAEQTTDGEVKHFSCGHQSKDAIVHTLGNEAKFSIGRLGLRSQLSTKNSDVISYAHGATVDTILVSMQQEMYKDAIHFINEARRHQQMPAPDPFAVLRNIRAAILFSFASIESSIYQYINEYLKQNRTKMSQGKFDRWAETYRYLSISDKVNEGIELLGGKRLESDKSLWGSFQEFKLLRDGLVHYTVENVISMSY